MDLVQSEYFSTICCVFVDFASHYDQRLESERSYYACVTASKLCCGGRWVCYAICVRCVSLDVCAFLSELIWNFLVLFQRKETKNRRYKEKHS